ncbi:MAG: ion transporter [Spirosomataceae bacterium]
MTTFRKKVYHLLETSAGSRKGWIGVFNGFLFTLIFLNGVAIVLHSVEEIYRNHIKLFNYFELFSVTFFTIEYGFRVWCSVEKQAHHHPIWGRLKYIFTFWALVDLMGFMPFFLSMFDVDLGLVRVLRLFRLLRLFRITRYVLALNIIENVIKEKKEELVLSFIFILFLLLISSSLMYYIEHPAQPKVFKSIPATLWWGVATITTVGYGDAVPITPLGKIFGGIVALAGVGLFALPSGILASGFAEEIGKRNRKKRTIICPHCSTEIDLDMVVHEHKKK